MRRRSTDRESARNARCGESPTRGHSNWESSPTSQPARTARGARPGSSRQIECYRRSRGGGIRVDLPVVLRWRFSRTPFGCGCAGASLKVGRLRGGGFVPQVPGFARASLRPCYAIVVLAFTFVVLASPALAAAADPTIVRPVYVFGIPVDFILFGLTLLGVAVFHHYTLLSRAERAGRNHDLQTDLHRVQIRRRPDRLCAAHAARMGDPGQPVPAADGICTALAPLREEPDSGRDAGLPARRLEGRRRAASDRVHSFRFPGQYRCRADRRHHGAPCFPGQSPHRLPCRDRRGIECGRRRQRRRRHDHHDDVDRRHQSVGRDRGLCGRRCRIFCLRDPGRE